MGRCALIVRPDEEELGVGLEIKKLDDRMQNLRRAIRNGELLRRTHLGGA